MSLDTATCNTCEYEGPITDFLFPFNSTSPTNWPIHFTGEGVWCKACAAKVETPEQPSLYEHPRVIVATPKGDSNG